MKVTVALALVFAIALSELPASAGVPDVPEARRKVVAAVRSSDRDVAALEAALNLAISQGAKLQAQDTRKALEELKKLLGALKTFKTEKARLLADAEKAQADARRAMEQAQLAEAAQHYSGSVGVIAQVVLVVIAVVTSVWTTGAAPGPSYTLVIPAVGSLTATLLVSLSQVSQAMGVIGAVSPVASAMAATQRANAAAMQAQARLLAAPRLPSKPLPAVLTPTATPR